MCDACDEGDEGQWCTDERQWHQEEHACGRSDEGADRQPIDACSFRRWGGSSCAGGDRLHRAELIECVAHLLGSGVRGYGVSQVLADRGHCLGVLSGVTAAEGAVEVGQVGLDHRMAAHCCSLWFVIGLHRSPSSSTSRTSWLNSSHAVAKVARAARPSSVSW